MVVLEVIIGILGSLAVVVLTAATILAIAGFIAALLGIGVERCDRCCRLRLASPELSRHRCPEHHELAIAHLWRSQHSAKLFPH